MSDQATRANASATELERLDHWIGGASAQPATGDYIETVSPMTGALSARSTASKALKRGASIAGMPSRGGPPLMISA